MMLLRGLHKLEWFALTLSLALALSGAAWAFHNFNHDVADSSICSTPNDSTD